MPDVPYWGDQFPITFFGSMPAVATMASGGFVAVWATPEGGGGERYIEARLFGADYQPLGDAVRVASPGFGIQENPSVTVLDDGRLVVAWSDKLHASPAHAAILRIQADGTLGVDKSDFAIGSSPNSYKDPKVVALPGGGFLVSAISATAPHDKVASYVYNSSGDFNFFNEVSARSAISDTAIAQLSGGSRYLTVFSFGGATQNADYEIAARIYPTGRAEPGISVSIVRGQGLLPDFAIAPLTDGRFITVWTAGDTVLATILNANGTTSKATFTLYDASNDAAVSQLAISAIEGGLALAVRQGDDVFVETYNVDGQDVAVRSTAVMAHTQAAGIQSSPSISVLADGRFVVGWIDGGVHGRTFDDRKVPVNLQGTVGNDKFYGSLFDDTLRGGNGSDTLDGGNGNDLFLAEESPDGEGRYGADIYSGGGGTGDKIAYWYAQRGVFIVLGAQEHNGGAADGDRIQNIDIIDGSAHDDTIIGDSGNEAFWGDRGDDFLSGGIGDDSLKGGDGNDKLDGGTGNDLFWGENGDDFLIADGGGRDTFVGGSGYDTVSYADATSSIRINLTTGERAGVAVGDVYDESIEMIAGTDHADRLDGDQRDNGFQGADGDDVLQGHGGNDVLSGGKGQDAIDGGGGSDTVVLTGTRADYDATFNQDGSVTLKDKRADRDGIDTILNVEIFQFSDNTKLSLAGLVGDVGKILTGDVVAENSAAGISIGSFIGTAKAGGPLRYDLVADADGRFAIDAATGVLKVADGVRLDFEQAASHSITVRMTDASGASTDKTLAILVQDVLDERAFGSAAADVMKGGAGQDSFSSLAGNDVIDTGLGNDTLVGGLGRDVLTGGLGKDVFVFDTGANKATNLDTLADFVVKDDTIWLDNAMFRKLGKKGSEVKPAKLDKKFLVVGDKAKDMDDYLIYSKKKGVLYYDADGAGKGKAVEIATLKKNLKMTNADFFVI